MGNPVVSHFFPGHPAQNNVVRAHVRGCARTCVAVCVCVCVCVWLCLCVCVCVCVHVRDILSWPSEGLFCECTWVWCGVVWCVGCVGLCAFDDRMLSRVF